MRMARRMGLIGRKAKYTWAVYEVKWGADENLSPYTGSFTLSSSFRYKMAALSYTATSSGFALTNATQTSRSGLQVGHYLVNVSTSSSTATSGSYLYKITRISGSTFYYTRWAPSQVKGDVMVNRVSSNTFDYPENGIQNGYWYVLVSGSPEYTWDRYTISAMAQELGRAETSMTTLDSLNSYRYAVSAQYADIVSTNDGYIWVLNNPSFVRADLLHMLVSVDSDMATGYFANTEGQYLYQFLVDDSIATQTQRIVYTVIQYGIQISQGTEFLGQVTSSSPDVYPVNGEQDGYWYVLVS